MASTSENLHTLFSTSLHPDIKLTLGRANSRIFVVLLYQSSFSGQFNIWKITLKDFREWNKLDPEIRNAETYASFQKMLLNFIRTIENSTYKIYDLLGIKLLATLRLGFSHLFEHKFRHNFAYSLNPLWFCSLEIESTLHFFLSCQNYTTLRTALMTDLKNINDAIMSLNESNLLHVILYGNKNFDNNMDIGILTTTIKFIKDSERFDQPLV